MAWVEISQVPYPPVPDTKDKNMIVRGNMRVEQL